MLGLAASVPYTEKALLALSTNTELNKVQVLLVRPGNNRKTTALDPCDIASNFTHCTICRNQCLQRKVYSPKDTSKKWAPPQSFYSNLSYTDYLTKLAQFCYWTYNAQIYMPTA